MKLVTTSLTIVASAGLALAGMVADLLPLGGLLPLDDIDPGDCVPEAAPPSGGKVPGSNPFFYCELQGICHGVVDIGFLDLYPMPPQANRPYTLAAIVTFTGLIVQGTYIELSTNISGIHTDRYDVCAESVANGGPYCPFVEGTIPCIRIFNLTSEIPRGTYYEWGAAGIEAGGKETDFACFQGNLRI